MSDGHPALIAPPVINTVISSVASAVNSDSLDSAPPVSSTLTSSISISKRAQRGQKDPPGSRNRRKKARKAFLAAAVESVTARAAELSASLADTNTVLADAVAARDSARLERDKAIGKAEEWEHKYRITQHAADRERLETAKSRLLEVQRAQNTPHYSGSPPDRVHSFASPALPAPSSLVPSPYSKTPPAFAPSSSTQLP